MPLALHNPVEQTIIFEILLSLLIAATLWPKKNNGLSSRVSSELKGVAILAVIFGHVGYYLSNDTRFLYPLSIMAGVGVNLFLFLSGYGLTLSAEKNPLGVFAFYRKRLGRLFIPLWVALAGILSADALLLHLHYPRTSILEAMVGFFPHANLYTDINSPLWYFTLILGYYLLFPLVTYRRTPLVGGFLLLGGGYYLTHRFGLHIDSGVLGLYRLHIFAFPLGCISADLVSYLKKIFPSGYNPLRNHPQLSIVLRTILSFLGILLICYLLIHSDVGTSTDSEARVSLLTMGITIGTAILLPLESRFLTLAGTYSYELYLLHWPLMYRHHTLYDILPSSLATLSYLGILLAIGYLVHTAVEKVLAAKNKKPS